MPTAALVRPPVGATRRWTVDAAQAPRVALLDGFALEADRPGPGGVEPGDGAQQRGLAGAVAADDAGALGAEAQIEILEEVGA